MAPDFRAQNARFFRAPLLSAPPICQRITMRVPRMACALAALALVLALLGTASAAAAAAGGGSGKLRFYDGLRVTESKRVINLKAHAEASYAKLELKNVGGASADHFLFALPASKAAHVSYVTASDDKGDLAVTSVDAGAVEGLPSWGKGPKPALYKVALRAALAPGEEAKVKVEYACSHTQTPLPERIRENENQLVEFRDNHYLFSPYPVASDETTVRLASENVISRSKRPKPSKVKKNRLELGPYADVAPFSFEELYVHFENNAPFITFLTLVKTIEISHWGNVAVMEEYLIKNTGAELDGPFSRIDYARRRSGPAAFSELTATLPPRAFDIYYRDSIGNISTSHVRPMGERGTLMQLKPRFPMYGGWKTDFYVSYNVPSRLMLFRDADNPSTFVLNATASTSFETGVVDSLELRVVLPERATNIRYRVPFAFDSVTPDTHFTLMDTVGRPVVVMRKRNLVDWHHGQHLQVSYTFDQRDMLNEPLLIAAGFFCLFVLSMIGARVNLSLSSHQRTHSRRGRAGQLAADLLDQYDELEVLLQAGAEGKAQVKIEAFKAIAQELRKADPALASDLAALQDAVDELRAASRAVADTENSDAANRSRGAYQEVAARVEVLLQRVANDRK